MTSIFSTSDAALCLVFLTREEWSQKEPSLEVEAKKKKKLLFILSSIDTTKQ